MGLFAQVAQILADYRADTDEAQAEAAAGIQAMFDRGAAQPAQPDRFSRSAAAYRAEVDAASGDTSSASPFDAW